MTDQQNQHSSDLDAIHDEMDRLSEEFENQATENRRRRDQADLDERQKTVGDQPEREFQAQVFLLIPYYQNGRQRPLQRRPDAAAPIRSSGVTVTRNGTRTDEIEAGGNYTVECTILNAGGLSAGTVHVELFVEHEGPTVTVDANQNGTVEISKSNPSQDGDFTGFSTFSPNSTRPITQSYSRLDHPTGDGIDPLGYAMFSGSQLSHETLIDVGRLPSADADPSSNVSPRSWSVRHGSKPKEYLVDRTDGRKPYRSDDFTLRIYDIGIPADLLNQPDYDVVNQWAYVYNKLAKPQDLTGIQDAGTFLRALKAHTVLAEVEGRWVQGTHGNQKQPLALSSDIDRATLEARTRTSITANGQTSVTFDYGAPPQQNDRKLTAFYVRAYSLAPEDTPQDWNAINHTNSRFMGRSELYWPI